MNGAMFMNAFSPGETYWTYLSNEQKINATDGGELAYCLNSYFHGLSYCNSYLKHFSPIKHMYQAHMSENKKATELYYLAPNPNFKF